MSDAGGPGLNAGTIYATLRIRIEEFRDGLDEADRELRRAQRSMTERMDKLKEVLGGVADKLLIVGTVGATGLAGMVAMANEAVESENLFTVSLGKNADAVRSWSEGLRKDLGLNSVEVRKSSATFYAMFESMKLGEENSLKLSKGLTQLSYDMASFYNLDPSTAFQKLQAGISGETEPLKQLGIIVSETTVNNYALTQGMIKQGETLSEQGKVMARYGVIMEATAKAQGDMARTLDSPVNQLRIMGEQAKQTAIEFGTMLIPMEQKVITELKKFTDYMSKLTDKERENILQMALWGIGLSLLIGTALKGTLAIMELITTMRELGITLAAVGKFTLWAAVAVAAIAAVSYAWSEYQKEQNKAIKEEENRVDAMKASVDLKQKQAAEIKSLADEYDNLKSKTKLTTDEHNKLYDIQNRLKDLMPDVNKLFGNQNGVLTLNTDVARKYADQLGNVRSQLLSIQTGESLIAQRKAKKDLLDAVDPGFLSLGSRQVIYQQLKRRLEEKEGIIDDKELAQWQQKLINTGNFSASDKEALDSVIRKYSGATNQLSADKTLEKLGKLKSEVSTGDKKKDDKPSYVATGTTGDKKKDEITFIQRFRNDRDALSREADLFPDVDYSQQYLGLLNSYMKEGSRLGILPNDGRLSNIVQEYNTLKTSVNQKEQAKKQLDEAKKNAEYWKKYNEVNPNIQQSKGLTPGNFNPYQSSDNGRYIRYGDRANPQGGRVPYSGNIMLNSERMNINGDNPTFMADYNLRAGIGHEKSTEVINTFSDSVTEASQYLQQLSEEATAAADSLKKENEQKKKESDLRRQASSDSISNTLAGLGQGGSLGEMASGFMAQIATQGFGDAMGSWIEKSKTAAGIGKFFNNPKTQKGLTAISSLYTAYQGASEGGALGGALSGAEAGMTIGGPIGAGIGALAGLFIGGSEANKRAQARAEAIQAQQLEQLRKLNNAIVPVSDYFRSAGLNQLTGRQTFGSAALATGYAVQSSRGVR